MTTIRSLGLLLILVLAGSSIIAQVQDIRSLKANYKNSNAEQCLKLWTNSADSIQQIVLIRHGEPNLNKKGWRNRDQAIQYMHDYDSVGVIPFSILPLCTADLDLTMVYHSAIPRATNTAHLAFDGFELKGSLDFREFERKTMKFCNIKMPLKCWTTGSRVLWFMGMNKKEIESFREAKQRAENNAAFLSSEAAEQSTVVLVAHGLHNKYVKKYLHKMGWKKVYDEGNGYLSVKILAKPR